MTRIIVDNNLWVSFLIGKKLSALEYLLNSEETVVYVCGELIEEFLSVTSRPKIARYVSADDVRLALQVMRRCCQFAVTEGTAESPVRDPRDLYLLSLAETIKADYILTGDKDLLVLGDHHGTRIITFRDFMDRFLS